MKAGDLVTWSLAWLAGCDLDKVNRVEFYRNQIGVLIERLEEPPSCWFVVWNDGKSGAVHKEYVEVICK